jgi:hypothetical protein
MTAFAHSAPVYEFESSRWTTVGVGLADRGRRLLGNIPPSPVLHGKLAPSGSAGYCLLFPDTVAVAISAACPRSS